MSTTSDHVDEIKTLATFQLPSLIWPTRRPQEKCSYLNEFATHISVKFNESSPHRYASELQEFSSLRNKALSCLNEKATRDQQSLKDLKKYYCQLTAILVRFKDSGATFSWKDSFGPTILDGSIEFEINNVMYCIAAVHNELGAKIPKTSDSSSKEAIANFTSALWWVIELRDNRGGLKPKEMGHDLLTFFDHVLKAQAQEIIVAKAMRSGNLMSTQIAMITSQIASDYEVAYKLAQNPLYTDPLKDIMMGTSIFHNWKSTVTFKYRYFSALTYLLMAMSFRDDNAKEIGARIGWLKRSFENIEHCKKLVTDTIDQVSAKVAYELISTSISKKLDKAIQYNTSVYHAKVLTEDQLNPIEGKLLINPTPFTLASMPDFKDLFYSLITIESVQVSSYYTELKDKIARDIKTQVEKQDEELAHMMSTLNIDKKNLKIVKQDVPEELLEICAELSMSPQVVDEVLTKLEELDDKSEEIHKLLERAEELLKRNPNQKYESELRRFKAMQQESLKTIQSLHKQLHPDLQRDIQRMASSDNPLELLPEFDNQPVEGQEIIRKLDKLLDKVEEMKYQRVTALDNLKKSLEQDDVLKHVVSATSEHEVKNVFKSEITKHDKYLKQLEENLKLQNTLLDTLENVNAEFGKYKLDLRSKRATYLTRVESLKKYYVQFKATMEGIDQGMEYHNKMLDIVRKFCENLGANYELHDLLN